jgi:hypothetical protein
LTFSRLIHVACINREKVNVGIDFIKHAKRLLREN